MPVGRERLGATVDTLRGCTAFAGIVLNTVVWFVPMALFGIVRRLLPKSVPALAGARTFCGVALASSLQGWVGCAKTMASALRLTRLQVHVEESGRPPISRKGWYLIVSNHQSWADILVLVFAFHGIAPPFVFFTKRELIWVPLIGVALWLLEFPYVRRYSRAQLDAHPALREHDREAVRRACAGIRERPTSVLNFLEGTRFTAAKRAAQDSPYETLLKPKTGGLGMALDALADRVTAVVDVTIDYADGAPTFWDYLCGRCRQVEMRVRVLPPPAPDDLRPWVGVLWDKKNRYLSRRRTVTAQRQG